MAGQVVLIKSCNHLHTQWNVSFLARNINYEQECHHSVQNYHKYLYCPYCETVYRPNPLGGRIMVVDCLKN